MYKQIAYQTLMAAILEQALIDKAEAFLQSELCECYCSVLGFDFSKVKKQQKRKPASTLIRSSSMYEEF